MALLPSSPMCARAAGVQLRRVALPPPLAGYSSLQLAQEVKCGCRESGGVVQAISDLPAGSVTREGAERHMLGAQARGGRHANGAPGKRYPWLATTHTLL